MRILMIIRFALCALACLPMMSAPAAAQARSDNTHKLVGKWVGEYTCRQGETGVTVHVTAGQRPQMPDAVFEFYPTRNRVAPSGRYAASISFDEASGQVVLRPERWIERPSGYNMVGFRGTLSRNGDLVEGTIDSAGCSAIKIRRNPADAGQIAASRPAPVTAAPPPPVPTRETPPVVAPAQAPRSTGTPGSVAPPPAAQIQAASPAPAAPWPVAAIRSGYAPGQSLSAPPSRREPAADELYVLDVAGLRLSTVLDSGVCSRRSMILDIDSAYLLSRLDKDELNWDDPTGVYAQRYWMGCSDRGGSVTVAVHFRGKAIGAGVFAPGAADPRQRFLDTPWRFRWKDGAAPAMPAPAEDARSMALDLYWSASLQRTTAFDEIETAIIEDMAKRDGDIGLALYLRQKQYRPFGTFGCIPMNSREPPLPPLPQAAANGSGAALWQMAFKIGWDIGFHSCGGRDIFNKDKIFATKDGTTAFHLAACYLAKAAQARMFLARQAIARLSGLNAPLSEAVAFAASPSAGTTSCEQFAAAAAAGGSAGLCAVNRPDLAPTPVDIERQAEDVLLAKICRRETITRAIRQGVAPVTAEFSSIEIVGSRCRLTVPLTAGADMRWVLSQSQCQAQGKGRAICSSTVRIYCGRPGDDLHTGDAVRRDNNLECLKFTTLEVYLAGKAATAAAFDEKACAWKVQDTEIIPLGR